MREQPPKNGTHPDELLHLWMGQAEAERPPSRKGPSRRAIVGCAALGTFLGLGLARYAIDVLFIVAGLAALGLLLHLLGTWLAESEILSPGWFSIIVVGAALVAWAFLVPTDGLARYVPAPLTKALDRLESRGWARRAIFRLGEGYASGSATPTSDATTSAVVTLTASRSTTARGDSVVFTARVPLGAARPGASIRFWAGVRLLGNARLEQDRTSLVAQLRFADLAAGTHHIHAEIVGPVGLAVGRSASIRHTVRERAQ